MQRFYCRIPAMLGLILMSATCGVADDAISDSSKGPDVEQLRQEARIAAELGDFSLAVSRIKDAATQAGDQATIDRAQQALPAGGSQFANFGEILTLIMEQTSPPARWIQTDGDGGQISLSQQGVLLTSDSVMKSLSTIKDDSNLLKMADAYKQANHNTNARQTSSLRMVSLTRLAAVVRHTIKAGGTLPDDLRVLAGLNRIDYLFTYPETGDIVIAGPAGDWKLDADQRVVNVETGRPTLQLDDLVTLLQTFSRSGAGGFVCSIDPVQQQVQAVQAFVAHNQKSLNPATAEKFTSMVQDQLGLQNVIVKGVPADSRIASVIVDADYRMKEIGVGRRKGVKGMKSYFDLLSRSEQRGSGKMDALRWWMAIGYDAIQVSSDAKVFEFSGNAIQCLSEDQLVQADGSRTGKERNSRANIKFAELFTKFLPELAKQDVVFADLENVFDLSIVASLIQRQGLGQQVGFRADAFANDQLVKPTSVDVPEKLMTAAEYRVYNGRSVVVQVAGGVRVDISKLTTVDRKANTELDGKANVATPLGQQNGRWWWDAPVK